MSSNDRHWTDIFGDDATSPAEASTSRPSLDILLSAYLEDPHDLTSEQRQRVESHLETDPESRRMLAEFDLLTSELRNLPEPAAPRSFHLTPADVATPATVHQPTSRKPAGITYLDRLRQATAVAAVLFVAILAADLAVNSVFTGPDSAADSTEQAADREMVTESAELSVLEAPAEDSAESGAVLESAAEEESDIEALTESSEAEDAGDDAASADQTSTDQDAGASSESPLAAVTAGEDGEVTEGGGVDSSEGASDAAELPGRFVPTPTTPPFEAYVEPGKSADESALVAPTSAEVSAQPVDERNYWRAAEFGLAVVIALLIALIIFLPKFNRARRS